MARARFFIVRGKRDDKFSGGSGWPPCATRIATRCSEMAASSMPMKIMTTV
jgi:hypothetical protein